MEAHLNSPTLNTDGYEWETSTKTKDTGYGPIRVTLCCKIGPITNENYCPNCGKKIIRK